MFERMRLRKQEQINNRSGNMSNKTTVDEFKSAPLRELMIKPPALPIEATKKITTKKKKKFVISDTKEQIVDDIIDEKPSITDVKKALKEYSRISQEEFIDA